MFGFIVADRTTLEEQQLQRYRAVYCGLCAEIRRRYGLLRGMTLTYDLALLPLLLGAVYQPPETVEQAACPLHPLKGREQCRSVYTEYAADMNVILVYYKCLDDRKDDRDLLRGAAARTLEGCRAQIEQRWPRQCRAIRECLEQISAIEADALPAPDAAAHWFGVLMGELFWLQEDGYAETLRQLGYFLGKFIYLMDADVDLRDDLRKGRYNPLAFTAGADHRPLLEQMIGGAAAQLEKLPLHRDEVLLKNILYSGVWIRWQQKKRSPAGTDRPSDRHE